MFRFIFFVLLSFSLLNCSSQQSSLSTVNFVDLNKYIGNWYEIGALPAWFEKKCHSNITANYSWMPDNKSIKVINSCITKSGQEVITEGRAFITDNQSNSKLKVTFLKTCFNTGCLGGNYWILDLDADYQYVLIGEPSRDYLWILSRNKTLDARIYNNLLNKAKSLGFDISKIVKKEQN